MRIRTKLLAGFAATILIGAYGMRVARTTSDFFVASRSVNLSIICLRPIISAS